MWSDSSIVQNFHEFSFGMYTITGHQLNSELIFQFEVVAEVKKTKKKNSSFLLPMYELHNVIIWTRKYKFEKRDWIYFSLVSMVTFSVRFQKSARNAHACLATVWVLSWTSTQLFVCTLLGYEGMLTIHTILLLEENGQMKGFSIHQTAPIAKYSVKGEGAAILLPDELLYIESDTSASMFCCTGAVCLQRVWHTVRPSSLTWKLSSFLN